MATKRLFGGNNSMVVNNQTRDYNQSLLMEKKDEIQAIVKKRQRKAAITAALKEAETRGKPTLMNFAAKQSNKAQSSMGVWDEHGSDSDERIIKVKVENEENTLEDLK